MGLFDKLNQLTNSLNGIADNVTGSNNQQFNNAATGTLDGLGNINTDNANGNLASPGGFLKKSDPNVKLLETNMRQFANNSEFSRYLQNLLQSTGQFQIVPCEDSLKNTLCNDDIFYAQCSNGINYFIMSSLTYDDAKLAIGNVVTSAPNINNVRKVFIGYFNFDEHTLGVARNGGIEIFGINEFMEVNTDAQSKIIPDLNFGSHQSSFKAALSKALRSCNVGGNTSGSTFNNIVNSMENAANNLGQTVEKSVNSFTGSVGGAFGNNNVPQQNVNAGPQEIYSGELGSVVKLDKVNETPKPIQGVNIVKVEEDTNK